MQEGVIRVTDGTLINMVNLFLSSARGIRDVV